VNRIQTVTTATVVALWWVVGASTYAADSTDWMVEDNNEDWLLDDDPSTAPTEAELEEELEQDFEQHADANAVNDLMDDPMLIRDPAVEAQILSDIGGDNVRSVNQKECAIWLCLPLGFLPSACSGPRKAMIRRLFKRKGPAPSFSSCTADSSGSEFGMDRGLAAFIPPNRLVKNRMGCNMRDGEDEVPLGCVGTVKHSPAEP